ncbi:MAG: nitric oxide synthase oxygenase [Lentimonas sp.]
MDSQDTNEACPFAGNSEGSQAPALVDTRWEAQTLSQSIARLPRSSCGRSSGQSDLRDDAQQAWRNSVRCIARPRWQSLELVDARSLEDPDDIFEALRTHLRLATNGGAIKSMMTLFKHWDGSENEIRIWNHQLIRYACYRARDRSLLGDPMNLKLTNIALALGWIPPSERGAFDLLPLIVQAKGTLRLYPLAREDVLEVSVQHPDQPKIQELGLKWYALPAVADMLYATPSQVYPSAPFNGHYMATEIGARNLADPSRYDQLHRIAICMGIDPNLKTNPLWKDHAMLALHEALLHSFTVAGVRLENHHQASDQFTQFCKAERKRGRKVHGDWTWLVPPMSGSANSVFHQRLEPNIVLPNFFYQTHAWETKCGRALLAKHAQ